MMQMAACCIRTTELGGWQKLTLFVQWAATCKVVLHMQLRCQQMHGGNHWASLCIGRQPQKHVQMQSRMCNTTIVELIP